MNDTAPNKRKRGRPRKHNWPDLLSKEHFLLFKWVDYNCTTEGIMQQVRNAAGVMNLKAVILPVKDHDGIEYVEVMVRSKDDI